LKKPTEKQIEAFVRHPEQLTESEASRIKKHLKSDEELRLIAEWFSHFYEKMDEYISNTKKAALEKRRIPSEIDLKPIPNVKKNGRRVFVLAAQTETTELSSGIEQIRTFASKKYGTLVRILNLQSRNKTKIDVISDHLGDDDIVILTIPGQDLNLVTGPGGRLEVSSDELSAKDVQTWETCKLNLPVLKSKVNRKSSKRDGYLMAQSGAGVKSVELKQGSDHVYIYPDQTPPDSEPVCMVLAEADKIPSLWHLKDGRVSVPKEKFQNRKISLFFYN